MNGSNRVFSYLFYVVCLGLVVFWVISIDVKEKRLEEQFAAIQQEVLPYEKEIAAIRNDLDEAYKDTNYNPEKVLISVGVCPDSLSDTVSTNEKLNVLTSEAAIILDCSKEETRLIDIAGAQQMRGNDIALMLSTGSEDELKTAENLYAALMQEMPEREIYVILRKNAESAGAIEFIQEHSFHGVARYSDAMEVGIDDRRTIYIAYGMIRSRETLQQAVYQIGSKTTAVLLILDGFHNSESVGATNEFDEIISALKEVDDQGLAIFMSMHDIIDEVNQGLEKNSEKREQYYLYEKEQQSRLDELEEAINNVYKKYRVNEKFSVKEPIP